MSSRAFKIRHFAPQKAENRAFGNLQFLNLLGLGGISLDPTRLIGPCFKPPVKNSDYLVLRTLSTRPAHVHAYTDLKKNLESWF